MDLFQAVVLAFVQGVTAWIPVSSKTQVVLAGNALFAIPFKTALAFAILLHVGDLVAALWKYRREYVTAAGQVIGSASSPLKLIDFSQSAQSEEANEGRFLVVSIAASCAVALPLYLLVRKFFENLSGEPLLFAVGALLLAMALVTWLSRRRSRAGARVTLFTAVATGAAQGLAVVPGISRSGITQCALLLQGVSPPKAVRLSFLMAAPLIAAAFSAFLLVEGFGGFSPAVVVVGIAVSAVASLLTMGFMTRVARLAPAHLFLAAVGILAMVPLAVKYALGVGG